jgi:hypothetical protein
VGVTAGSRFKIITRKRRPVTRDNDDDDNNNNNLQLFITNVSVY